MKKLIRDACEMVRKAGPVSARLASYVILLSATVISSCLTDYQSKTCPGDGKTIVFKEVITTDGITTTTRAMSQHPIENVQGDPHKGQIPVGKSFGVFAWTYDPVAAYSGFDNAPVMRGANEFTHTGGVWPARKEMSFMAYYPYTGTGESADVTDFKTSGGLLDVNTFLNVSDEPVMEIDFETPTAGDKHIDLMYAYRPESLYNTGEVDITFRHALSRMKFSARIEGFKPGVEVKVTGITVKNVVLKGTLTVNDDNTAENPLFVKPSWSLDDGVTGEITVADDQLNSDQELDDNAKSLITAGGDLIVLPQPSTDLELEITATQDDQEFSYLVPLVATPDLEMNEIYHYVLTLTSQEATLEVLVLPWDNGGERDSKFDGEYRLEVSEREFFFPSYGDLQQTITIFTTYPDGWRIENFDYNTTEEWVLFPTDGDNDVWGMECDRIIYLEPNTSSIRRKATFDVVAGNMHKTITVWQEPAVSVLASPGVLGVGARTGKLTLRGSKEFAGTNVEWQSEFGPLADETVYVAYFKWGSLIGLGGLSESDEFGKDGVVWTPAGFRGFGNTEENTLTGVRSHIESSFATPSDAFDWVPYIDEISGDWPETNDIDAGIGDPCMYVEGENGNAPYRMPAIGELESIVYNNIYTPDPVIAGTPGSVNNSWTAFLPYAGIRRSTGITEMGTQGWYLSNIGFYHSKLLVAENVTTDDSRQHGVEPNGYAVRCVKRPMLAPPGTVGYRASTNGLTLCGSKEYKGTVFETNSPFGPVESETVYVAYFKWGSVIAVGGGENGDVFDASDVVWTPNGYDDTALKTEINNATTAADKWSKIKTVGIDHGNSPEPSFPYFDPVEGWGDPCALDEVFKGDATGAWKTPVGGPWNGMTASDFDHITVKGIPGIHYGNTMFLPMAGLRNVATGQMSEVWIAGAYTSATTVDHEYISSGGGNPNWKNQYGSIALRFYQNDIYMIGGSNPSVSVGTPYNVAMPIRCVQIP